MNATRKTKGARESNANSKKIKIKKNKQSSRGILQWAESAGSVSMGIESRYGCSKLDAYFILEVSSAEQA
jgi:hypothetical protein